MHCKEQSIWPIVETKEGPVQLGDSQFSDLKKMVKKPSQKSRKVEPWISDATWRLADQRTELGRTHMAKHQEQRTEIRRFQAELSEGRR